MPDLSNKQLYFVMVFCVIVAVLCSLFGMMFQTAILVDILRMIDDTVNPATIAALSSNRDHVLFYIMINASVVIGNVMLALNFSHMLNEG
ncbi:MAG: hypothetical protein ACRCXZ_07395 [Patescibacteria group bacterium]